MLNSKKTRDIYTAYLDALQASMSNPRHSVSDAELSDLVRADRITPQEAMEYSIKRDADEELRRQELRVAEGGC